MQHSKTAVIINPKSGNGKTEKNLTRLKDDLACLGSFELLLTQSKNHATSLTNQALKDGFERIIAVGGDGTFNEVINGFFEDQKQINPKAFLGLIPGGTGSDFIKSVGIPNNQIKAIKIIEQQKSKKLHLGKVTFQKGGEEKSRYFINIADAGLGGEVVERVNKTTKIFGGFASFLMGTIATVMEYKNTQVTITLDDQLIIQNVVNNIVVGNGKFFGGGMKILPEADPFKPFFDVVIIGDINKLDFFRNIPKIYQGTHIKEPKLMFKQAKKVKVESSYPLKIDVDGEQEGITPVEFTIIESTINLIVP